MPGPQEMINRQVWNQLRSQSGAAVTPQEVDNAQTRQVYDYLRNQSGAAVNEDEFKDLKMKVLDHQRKQLDQEKSRLELEDMMKQLNINPWQMMRR